MVIFDPDESIETVATRGEQEKTMLTAYFDLNKNDPIAHQYTYQELPQHFIWDCSKKVWKQRQRGYSIGRMYFVSPTAGERFYLRCLLTTVKGVTSWKELCTVDGTEYPTFHATCLARGLLENNDEWRQTLLDASLTHVGQSLRRLFCLILRHCVPSEPHRLWEQFRQHLCDDLGQRLQRFTHTDNPIPDEDVYDYGLFLINDDLCQHGTSLSCFPSMPPIRRNWSDDRVNRYLLEQIVYDRDNERHLAEDTLPLLNRDQCVAFDTIFASACADNGITFFLHGPGGTGKTFLYNTLCHRL